MGVTPQRPCAAGSRPETGPAGARPAGRLRQRAGREGLHLQRDRRRPRGRQRRLPGAPLRRPRRPRVRVLRRHAAVPDPRARGQGRRRGRARHERPGASPVRTAVLDHASRCAPRTSRCGSTPRAACSSPSPARPATQVGVVDVYDVSRRLPRTRCSRARRPLGILGHEGGFTPTARPTGPRRRPTAGSPPSTSPTRRCRASSGAARASPRTACRVSDDGNRAYLADVASDRGYTQNYRREITNGGGGMRILDTSPGAGPRGRAAGARGRLRDLAGGDDPAEHDPGDDQGPPYVIEFDEYDSNVDRLPPGRERRWRPDHRHRRRAAPEGRQPASGSRCGSAVPRTDQADDPGASSGTQGYAAHYCAVPTRTEPGILACGTIVSGLRVFDVRDPLHPREVAYANHPAVDVADAGGQRRWRRDERAGVRPRRAARSGTPTATPASGSSACRARPGRRPAREQRVRYEQRWAGSR